MPSCCGSLCPGLPPVLTRRGPSASPSSPTRLEESGSVLCRVGSSDFGSHALRVRKAGRENTLGSRVHVVQREAEINVPVADCPVSAALAKWITDASWIHDVPGTHSSLELGMCMATHHRRRLDARAPGGYMLRRRPHGDRVGVAPRGTVAEKKPAGSHRGRT